ncbi:MAG: hypothetical protein ACQEP1_00960 [Nanobdellota archaeon]
MSLNRILGKNKQKIIKHVSQDASRMMEDLYEYYDDFQKKLDLFNSLKEQMIDARSNLNKGNRFSADKPLKDLKEELKRIKRLIKEERSIEREEHKYSYRLLDFIRSELKKGKEYEDNPNWERYRQFLTEAKDFLEGNNDGIFHLLACQLNLLKDIRKAEKKGQREKLRTLEIEIMRFGKYLEKEAEIIKHPMQNLKRFKNDMRSLRKLGLMYSESTINKHNLGLITTRLNNEGHHAYGAKGIGVIKKDNVDFRFVKGEKEKHAEVVQMLYEGIAGAKLSNDVAIISYLRALTKEKIAKIAGFEMQLEFDKNDELKIINIDYESTILKIQIDRALSGERVNIDRRDFNRLNYSLMFSINKELLDKDKFRYNIERHGSKIKVKDRRILPFIS